MADEARDGLTSIFDLDPHGTVDLEDFPPTDQTPADAQVPASDTEGTEDDAPTLDPPQDLPPELQARWEQEQQRVDKELKKHQRSYTKRQAKLSEREKLLDTLQQKANVVDRFYSDPTYATQTLQEAAQRLGYTLSRTNGQPREQPQASPQGSPPMTGGQVPAHVAQAVEEAVKGNPDLAFLAPMIAQTSWAIAQATTQEAIKPFQDDAAARQKSEEDERINARNEEFRQSVAELEAEGLDWEDVDTEMEQRLIYLRNALSGNGSWRHPQYGSIVRLLYNWAKGPQAAQAEAARRTRQAMLNRSSTSTAARSPGVNADQLIKEAKTQQERWAIAFKASMAEHVPANMRR